MAARDNVKGEIQALMNLPDSRWLAVLRKVEWWLLAAIAAAAAAVLALAQFTTPRFGQLPPASAWWILSIGVLAVCLLLFKAIDRAFEAVRKSRISKVRRRPSELSKRQIEFLMQRFTAGSGSFERPEGVESPRWLKELMEWKYIESLPRPVWTPGTPDIYSISKAGRRELEKWHRKSR